MLDIGDRLSAYEPLWENWYKDIYIGGGNFGKVYRLKTEFYGETMYTAVKIISVMLEQELTLVDDKTAYFNDKKQAMVQEIINMYRLKDKPHLVQCINHGTKDVFDDNGEIIGFDILIQMNYYRSLTSYMKERGQLSSEKVKRLALQIANALKSMHEINMLHRDIKIENIYVDKDENFLLGDFGISKQETLSSYSTLAGTQPFIAPEVWRVQHTNRRYTKTADIYSYGISLYYLLNGNRLPLVKKNFTRNQIDDAVFDRLNGKAFPEPENGSKQLKAVVMKCCSYELENRFQSMDEVIDALDKGVTLDALSPVIDEYATMFAGASQSFKSPLRSSGTNTVSDSTFSSGYSYCSDLTRSKLNNPDSNVAVAPSNSASTAKTIALVVMSAVLVLMGMLVLFLVYLRSYDKEKDREKANAVASVQKDTTTDKSLVTEPQTTKSETTTTVETVTTPETTTIPETSMTTTIEELTTTTTTVTTLGQVTPRSLSYVKSMYVNTSSDNLMMRNGPSYSYDLVFKDGIPKGTFLDIYSESYDPVSGETWAYVSYAGYSGWCTERYMSYESPNGNIIFPPYYVDYPYTLTVVVNDLNFRTGPGKNYNSMGKINKGSNLILVGYQSNAYTDLWLFVEYNGKLGWIMSYDSENPYVEFD